MAEHIIQIISDIFAYVFFKKFSLIGISNFKLCIINYLSSG